jgi:hypothetical protein
MSPDMLAQVVQDVFDLKERNSNAGAFLERVQAIAEELRM